MILANTKEIMINILVFFLLYITIITFIHMICFERSDIIHHCLIYSVPLIHITTLYWRLKVRTDRQIKFAAMNIKHGRMDVQFPL